MSSYLLRFMLMDLQSRFKIPKRAACMAAHVGDHTFHMMRLGRNTVSDADVLKLARVVRRWVPPGHGNYKLLNELIEGIERHGD